MLYQITSRAVLPVRMKGLHSYEDAYRMCCDWNSWHPPEDMAAPELFDPRAVPLEFM